MAVQIIHDTMSLPTSTSSVSPAIYANAFYDLLSAHDTRFSHVTDTDIITVNGTFKLQTYLGGWNHLGLKVLNLNDKLIFQKSTGAGARNETATCNVDLICTTDLVYADVKSISGDYGFIFFWHIKNNKNFIGITAPENSGVLTVGYIENTTIACIEESNSTFKFTTPTTYNLISPKLMFSDVQLMYGSTGTYSIVDEFKSCSQVNFRSTVTVGGKNYYAIGKNTLIEITS